MTREQLASSLASIGITLDERKLAKVKDFTSLEKHVPLKYGLNGAVATVHGTKGNLKLLQVKKSKTEEIPLHVVYI